MPKVERHTPLHPLTLFTKFAGKVSVCKKIARLYLAIRGWLFCELCCFCWLEIVLLDAFEQFWSVKA